jgi:hypothetical protein
VSTAPKSYSFVASTGTEDRYHDRLNPAGWDLRAFNATGGPILYNHDAGDGGALGLGRKDVLPIGKGRAYLSGGKLLVDVTFDPADTFAQQVESKVSGGFLNTVSVRYIMKDYAANSLGGVDCSAQELIEISLVALPGNAEALRVKAGAELGSTRSLLATRAPAVDVPVDRKAFAAAVALEARRLLVEAAVGDAARRAVDELIQTHAVPTP